MTAISDGWIDLQGLIEANPSTGAAMAEELLALRAKLLAYETAELPCDINLPPSTTITAGCKLTTLLFALEVRGMAKVTEFSTSSLTQEQK